MDWYGDTRTDILFVGSNGDWYVGRSTGTTDSPVASDTGISATTYPNLIPTDADGDGLDDLIAANSTYSTVNYGLHNGVEIPPDLAVAFTDGYGMVTSFGYASLPMYGGYTPYTTGAYPDADWRGPRYVTEQARGFRSPFLHPAGICR